MSVSPSLSTVSLCAPRSVSAPICLHLCLLYLCVHLYVSTPICLHLYLLHLCISVCTYVCVCVCVSTHHIYTYIYIYLHRQRRGFCGTGSCDYEGCKSQVCGVDPQAGDPEQSQRGSQVKSEGRLLQGSHSGEGSLSLSSGLQLTGRGPPTLRRTVCFTQSPPI